MNLLTSRRLRVMATAAAGVAALTLAGCGSDTSGSAESSTAKTSTTSVSVTSSPSVSGSPVSTSTETTATTADPAKVAEFCAVYKSYLEWSMKPENSDTMEKAYSAPGVPLTDANRQAIQVLIKRTQDANRDLLAAAPDAIKDDLSTSNKYTERSLQERLNSSVGIVASMPTDDERGASERLLNYTSANCPGLPA